ncbi:MAG: carbamoyltransferase C-terminal domain-containing protein, partial [Nanoarchaeota archaeon]
AWLETVFKEYMESLIDKNGASNVALSGGIFGNVKLNQRIHEVKGVKNIFIHPHMGDGGLGMGGALYIHNQERPMNVSLKDVYLGPEYSNKKIKKELDKSRLKYTYYKDPAGAAADLLAKGQIVARFDGRMEYGPRALGNRTIMYQTTDKSVNDWLNKDLKRTEFMPFAPVVLSKYAKKCFNNIKGAEYAAKFMTITFDCTEWMKKSCPGVVHLDNTARPQLIDRDANPGYFKILDEYRKLTGIPALINTSYNMHEEPIVCSPYDAIRAFKQGHLKNLLSENYIVNQK